MRVQFINPQKSLNCEVDAHSDEKLTQVASKQKIVIQQTCAGKATCTDCRVKVLEGGWQALGTPTDAEKRALGTVFHLTQIRLACQSTVQSDCTVEILGPQKRILKSGDTVPIKRSS